MKGLHSYWDTPSHQSEFIQKEQSFQINANTNMNAIFVSFLVRIDIIGYQLLLTFACISNSPSPSSLMYDSLSREICHSYTAEK